MKIYLDLIFFINFFYDFIILVTTAILLKRKVNIKRFIISGLIGSLSLLILLLNNALLMFVLKILTSILMCITAYKFINYKYTLYNLIYFYMLSTILAGVLYMLNINFAYEKVGPFFVFDGFSINYLLLLIISPIIFFYFSKYLKNKEKNNYYYFIEIVFDNERIKLLGFLDTGNNLKDPITKKNVIIVNNKKLKSVYKIRSPVYVPFQTINNSSLMKCYKPSFIIINNKKLYNYLIGLSPYSISNGVDCLLNSSILKEIND